MPSLREEAEFQRLMLCMNLCEANAVIAWADQIILASMVVPSIELIDVSLALGLPAKELDRYTLHELNRLLKLVPGPADLASAGHRVLGLLRDHRVQARPSLAALVQVLQIYSMEAEVPAAEREEAARFCDEFGELEYYGTPEVLMGRIERFLDDFST